MDDISCIVLGNKDRHLEIMNFSPLTQKIQIWNHSQIYRVSLFHFTAK